jgi:hypothetical protein
MFFKRRPNNNTNHDPSYNPNRTEDLYALTAEGYIIAQDGACQNEYIHSQPCPNCQHQTLTVMAKLNRSFQGLNELVVICTNCHERFSYIFDISNEVYQTWLAGQMGDLYNITYDGPPRSADPNQRYFS